MPHEFHIEPGKQNDGKSFIKVYAKSRADLPLPIDCENRYAILHSTGERFLDRIHNFQVREDDVWVITLPKCGTTWMLELAWLLINDLDYTTAMQVEQKKRSPFLEYCTIFPSATPQSLDAAERLSSPRLIKSHLPMHMLPRQLWTIKPKIIYVARDPNDAAISLYHFLSGLRKNMPWKEEFFNRFLNGDMLYQPQWPHCIEFWKLRDEPYVYFTSFERMKDDLRSIVVDVSNFLGKPVDDQQMDKLLDHLSFKKMKSNPMCNHLLEIKEAQTVFGAERNSFSFIRKGEVGSHKDEFTEDLIERFNKWTTDALEAHAVDSSEILYNATPDLYTIAKCIQAVADSVQISIPADVECILKQSSIWISLNQFIKMPHEFHIEPGKQNDGKNYIKVYAKSRADLPLAIDCENRYAILFSTGERFLERIHNFQVREDDVWVITLPKCGSTWMLELAWLLINDLDYTTAIQVDQTKRSPFLEYCTIFPLATSQSLDAAERMSSPRLIKSHLPMHMLPRQLWTIKPKIIYVTRDPKDAAISLYHFVSGLGTIKSGKEEFLNRFLNGDVIYHPYWPHCIEFWKLRDEPYVYFTSFERMKDDLRSIVVDVSNFLGKPVDDQQMDKLLDHLSFKKMKSNPMCNHLSEGKEAHTVLGAERNSFSFVRKGEVGSHKDEFTEDLIERFNKWTTDALEAYAVDSSEILYK